MARDRFKRRACRIGREFVIARDYPGFATMLHSRLRGTEDVPRRMKRDTHAVESQRRPIIEWLDARIRTQPGAHQRLTRPGGQIAVRPRIEMVGMRVRDDGALDRGPGVDMKIARRAVEAFRSAFKKRTHRFLSLVYGAPLKARLSLEGEPLGYNGSRESRLSACGKRKGPPRGGMT